MKKVIFILALLCTYFNINAQEFIRFNMNDNTFNGFYSEGIDSIVHKEINGLKNSVVYANGDVYIIPVDNIDSITVESATVGGDNIGEYRIYELNYENEEIKKVYIDNRACMFASKNGDFGANDSILFSSAYNGIHLMFITDDQGRIQTISDGKKYIGVEYSDNGLITTYNIDTENKAVQQETVLKNPYTHRVRKAPSNTSFFENIGRLFNNSPARPETVCEFGARKIDAVSKTVSNISELLKSTENPEYHNEILVLDGLAVAGDLAGILAALGAGLITGGLAWGELGVQIGYLFLDINTLINETHPDYERLLQYMKYYKEHYNLTLTTLDPINVSCKNATLRGDASANTDLNGNFNFFLYEIGNSNNDVWFSANNNSSGQYHCSLTANPSNLNPGKDYAYWMEYECTVDGMLFRYTSDSYSEFKTLDSPFQITNRRYATSYKNDVVKVKILGDITLTESTNRADLSAFNEYGVYFVNNITGETIFEKLNIDSNNSFSIEIEIPESEFDKNYSTYVASCRKFKLGIYTIDFNGQKTEYNTIIPNIQYTEKPNFSHTTIELISHEVTDIKYRNNKEIKYYKTSYRVGYLNKGLFWVKSATHKDLWGGGYQMFNPTNTSGTSIQYFYYNSETTGYDEVWYEVYLKNGSVINGNNKLFFYPNGGENPSLSVGE